MLRTNFILLILIAGCALLSLTGCREPELESRWRVDPIRIDGELSDWKNCPPYFIDGFPLAVGISNDADYFYLRLSSRDQDLQQQVMTGGLTVWFDPAGGMKQVFGVAFPPAQQHPGGKEGSAEHGAQPTDPPQTDDARPTGPPPGGGGDLVLRGVDGQEIATLDAADPGYGIEIALQRKDGYLYYELKLPLAATSDRLFAVGAAAGAHIGIGLLTSKMERPQRSGKQNEPGERPRRSGDGPPAGGGQGPPGGGRGEFGLGDGPGGQQAAPLKFWFKLQLAPEPNSPKL